jgi:hypothetical protein
MTEEKTEERTQNKKHKNRGRRDWKEEEKKSILRPVLGLLSSSSPGKAFFPCSVSKLALQNSARVSWFTHVCCPAGSLERLQHWYVSTQLKLGRNSSWPNLKLGVDASRPNLELDVDSSWPNLEVDVDVTVAQLRVGRERTLAQYKIECGEIITQFWVQAFVWWSLYVRGF